MSSSAENTSSQAVDMANHAWNTLSQAGNMAT